MQSYDICVLLIKWIPEALLKFIVKLGVITSILFVDTLATRIKNSYYMNILFGELDF